MNRRKFLQLTGLSILATAASQLLAACGGGESAAEPVVQWTEFTVVDTGSGTYKVEIEYYHQHNLSALTALYTGNSYSGNVLTYMQSNQVNIAGQGGHSHYFQLSSANVTTLSGAVGSTVTIVADNASGASDHTHNMRITKTA